MRRQAQAAAAARFILPLLALLAIWEAVVHGFDVNSRVFPAIAPVARAGVEAVQDGTLILPIGASLGRIALGTLIGIVLAVLLRIAMGTSHAVSTFFTPLLRFFSVLAGIAWIPIATLWPIRINHSIRP